MFLLCSKKTFKFPDLGGLVVMRHFRCCICKGLSYKDFPRLPLKAILNFAGWLPCGATGRALGLEPRELHSDP